VVCFSNWGGVQAANPDSTQVAAQTTQKAAANAPELSPEQQKNDAENAAILHAGRKSSPLETLWKMESHRTWWMSADAKPEESKGTNVTRWILGNAKSKSCPWHRLKASL